VKTCTQLYLQSHYESHQQVCHRCCQVPDSVMNVSPVSPRGYQQTRPGLLGHKKEGVGSADARTCCKLLLFVAVNILDGFRASSEDQGLRPGIHDARGGRPPSGAAASSRDLVVRP